MAERRTVLDWIEASVKEVGNQCVAGSALARMFRDAFPDCNIRDLGFANLKDAALSIPGIRVVGRSGMDVLYQFSTESQPQLEEPPINTYWAIWANPNSKFVLSITESGNLEAVSRGTHPIEIDPPTDLYHKTIASNYLATLIPEHPSKYHLQRVLQTEGSWWPLWLSETQKNRSLNRDWIQYRTNALTEKLRDELSKTQLPESTKINILNQVTGSRSKTRTKPYTTIKPSEPSTTTIIQLRQTIKAAIDLMDAELLDKLQIPPSILLQAIKQTQSIRFQR